MSRLKFIIMVVATSLLLVLAAFPAVAQTAGLPNGFSAKLACYMVRY